MPTVKEIENLNKRMSEMSLKRKETNKPMPKNFDQLDTPPMIDMFKMISILNTGSVNSWKSVREMFIKGQLQAPDPSKVKDINASLYSKVQGVGTSQEDVILDQMNFDTNSVIDQIHDGTVDVDAGQEELEKMKMVEGDMPGQGKHKQGNWRG
tara:strand:+ start:102 stop:560 length:459 start_codon:yes stop_codon:yes gene_type:complete